MGGAKYMVGWPAGRPDFSKRRAAQIHAARPPAAALDLKNVAGRLASQPCVWPPPSILGIYYWYWYIIGYIFPIMGGNVSKINELLSIPLFPLISKKSLKCLSQIPPIIGKIHSIIYQYQ